MAAAVEAGVVEEGLCDEFGERDSAGLVVAELPLWASISPVSSWERPADELSGDQS